MEPFGQVTISILDKRPSKIKSGNGVLPAQQCIFASEGPFHSIPTFVSVYITWIMLMNWRKVNHREIGSRVSAYSLVLFCLLVNMPPVRRSLPVRGGMGNLSPDSVTVNQKVSLPSACSLMNQDHFHVFIYKFRAWRRLASKCQRFCVLSNECFGSQLQTLITLLPQAWYSVALRPPRTLILWRTSLSLQGKLYS